ncbi:hypothetical protein GOP47_0003338 [Adiantum capillus-veneris]|uniref:F-box domain-containing protein n=1 Tax=Adiantum capillus-veneris TaxID=13818 RepID=A0A9D4VBS5_ADICA|nr:hypothetical protein GOP47_0003338 [Adiantum capillus-veneris]
MGQASSSPSVAVQQALRERRHLISDALSGAQEHGDLTMQLSDECLACIFQKLSPKDRNVCSLVCKQWHRAESKARDRLALKAHHSLDAVMVPLFSRFEYVSCLSLKCSRKESSIDDEAILLVGRHCNHLTRLKLKSCKAISDYGIGQFAKDCGSLKKFSCASCGFGSSGLNMLLQNCPKLVDLSVKRLRRLRDNPEAIFPGAGKLQRLCLKEIMSAHLFGTLIAGSKNIHTLVLARNPGLWDQFFELIASHLSELVELHVETLNMGDIALKALSMCSKLEILHVAKVADCSDHGYTAIANGCRNLRKLHIDDRKMGRIGDESLLAFGRNSVELQELVLIGANVSVRSLALIASNCVKLERMALCNSEAVGDEELVCIAEKCGSLRKLCIKNCPISDRGLAAFACGCPSLLKVKVKKCKDITIASVTWLQMNRATLVVSLDGPPGQAEDHVARTESVRRGREAGLIRTPTSLFCSRSTLNKNRIVLAAGNLLRKFPKPS